jgi:hypothetical protein
MKFHGFQSALIFALCELHIGFRSFLNGATVAGVEDADVAAEVTGVVNGLGDVVNGLGGTVEQEAKVVNGLGGDAVNGLGDVVNGLGDVVNGLGDVVDGLGGDVVNGLGGDVANGLGGLVNAEVETVRDSGGAAPAGHQRFRPTGGLAPAGHHRTAPTRSFKCNDFILQALHCLRGIAMLDLIKLPEKGAELHEQ